MCLVQTFFLFSVGPHPKLTINSNQPSNPALISSSLCSWSKHMWNKQEGAAVVSVGCFPKENFCLQWYLGVFGCEVGGGMRVRTAALCLLGFISWFEWESSASFPPGPEAETSRERPSWWSDRWSVQSIILTWALRQFALACKYKIQPCWVPKWDVKLLCPFQWDEKYASDMNAFISEACLQTPQLFV